MPPKKGLSVYQSNRSELLLERLNSSLESSYRCDPFAARLILAPSFPMRSWIRQQLSYMSQAKIATGFRLEALHKGIYQVINKLFPNDAAIPPPQQHLSFIIEKQLPSLIEIPKSSQPHLAEEIAMLFLRYGEYAPKLIDKWQSGEGAPCWQKDLWRAIFSDYPTWQPLTTLLKKPLENLADSRLELHLFGFNHFSKELYSFFCRIAEEIPVNFYLLSPCQLFWSDIVSNRECVRLQRYMQQQGASDAQLFDLEFYLRECNPLLANFGSQAKELAKLLEEVPVEEFAEYKVAAAIAAKEPWQEHIPIADDLLASDREPNLLEAVQADLALLRTPKEQEIIQLQKCDTIQMHICGSPMREVQVAYDILLSLICRHECEEDPLLPSQIVVMAPDISLYKSYITEVFGSKASSLSYQMFASAQEFTSYIQLFFDLIGLSKSRLDAESILAIFEQEPFRLCHNIDSESLKQFREWLTHTNISWGYDAHHREAKLQEAGCQPLPYCDTHTLGTWANAFADLASSVVYSSAVDLGQAEILGRFAALISRLRAALVRIENDEEASISSWAELLSTFLKENLSPQKEDLDSHNRLLLALEELGSFTDQKACYPFNSFLLRLQKAVKKETSRVNSAALHAVRFGSFDELHGIAAKAIVCLGMDNEAFPRKEVRSPYNLLYSKEADADFFPTKQCHDRALVMEALLSARSYFIMIYSNRSLEGDIQEPSIVIKELWDYIDSSYSLIEKPVFHHAINPYDSLCFSLENPWRCSSPYWHKLALWYAEKDKANSRTHRFLSHFPPPIEAAADSEVIELKDLITLARNPLQLYYNKTLGIYLENKWKKRVSREDPLLFDPIENSQLVKSSVKQGLEAALQSVKKGMPVGAFKQVAIDSLQKEQQMVAENLQILQLAASELFSITLCSSCDGEPIQEESGWRLPPLCIGPFQIVGTLQDLSHRGIVSFVKDDKKQICRAWPEFLVACCIAKQHPELIEPQLILAKSGSVKKCFFEDPLAPLQKLLEYYQKALLVPSPLLPEWVAELIDKGPEEFAAKREKELSNPDFLRYNDYLLWGLGDKAALPEARIWASHWQEIAQDVFGLCLETWYK
jgi:exodeoxyribonuclease V gamma subunit